ncbi:MAG: LON peptidase substrate-binding domain-containing protein [Cellvibrionaceae bacterium]
MYKVAVFPIPNCVTFPGTSFPLHVFEPRYRNMIQYCLENDSLLAIAHTQKVLREAKTDQAPAEVLQSNQATYKPYPIFSAGKCELLQTLDDGRLYLQVHMESRFQAIEEEQTLPFSIFCCEAYSDVPVETDQLKTTALLKDKVLNRLLALTASVSDIQMLLKSEEWSKKSVSDFSFSIFSLLQFNPELQQQVLEMQSVEGRLNYLLDMLNKKS